MLLLSVLTFIPLSYAAFPFVIQQPSFAPKDDVKVPVHLGVQSRGRDALLCENIFDTVLKRVSPKIDLSLVYVGEYVAYCQHVSATTNIDGQAG